MQIGPRIRVGGTVGKVGEAIKQNLPSVEGMVGGRIAGAPGALAGSYLKGGAQQVKRDLSVGGRNAAAIMGGVGAVQSAGGIMPAIKTAASSAKQRLVDSMVAGGGGGLMGSGGGDGSGAEYDPTSGGGEDQGGPPVVIGHNADGSEIYAGGTAPRGPGGGGGGGGAPGAPGQAPGMSFLDKLLMAGTVGAGAEGEMRKRRLQNDAIGYAKGSYDARAPLRERAMRILGDSQQPDLSSMYSDSGNVYDKQRRAQMGAVR